MTSEISSPLEGALPVAPTRELLIQVFRVLQYYGDCCTYEAPRIGGVLQGCPRGERPTPAQLVFEARHMMRELVDVLGLPAKDWAWLSDSFAAAPSHPPASAVMGEVVALREALSIALDGLDEIALAGMSGTGMESEEGMRDWHARRAWEFIGIAARAKEAARKARTIPAANEGEKHGR